MSSVAKFAAVNSKIKVLQRNFLKNEDYRHLVDGQSVDEALQYLKSKTAYGEWMTDQETNDEMVKQLEVKFRVHILERYEKLVHYLVDQYRELFKVIFMRYEVENLKMIFRAIIRGENLVPIIEDIYRSTVFPHIDYDQLVSAKNIEEAVHLLQGTSYHRVLKPYVNEVSNRILFYLEMNLDRVYFNKLDRVVHKLPADEKKLVEELLGKNVDILNVQWIYRGIKHYKISSEELFNYCLTSGYALQLRELKDLCYAVDETDLLERLRKTRYAFLFKDELNMDRFMELGMEKYLYSTLKKIDKKGIMTIVPSIVYIHRLEYEMRDLFSLLQAKKFGLSSEDTEKFLVRTIH